MKKYLYLLFPALLAGNAASAQNISLVNPSPNSREFATSNGTIYYSAWTSYQSAAELRKVDASLSGTSVLKQFPAPITGLTAYANKVYFVSKDSATGTLQLFVSDGTPGGTSVLKYINPSGNAFNNLYFSANTIKVMNGKMYFMADDGVHGDELWTSDGTDTGTHLLKDINTNPGMGSAGVYYPGGNNTPVLIQSASFEVVNNKLFFYANDSNGHDGLWVSDGTNTGTTFVKDLFCYSFIPFGNKLVFTGVDISSNYTIYGTYISDGTNNGTTMLLQNAITSTTAGLADYATVNNTLYFAGRLNDTTFENRIYKTDGTAQGTILLKDNLTNSSISNQTGRPFSLTGYNGKLYFLNEDYFWQSDGSVQGTQVVKHLPLVANATTRICTQLMAANGKLYFKVRDSLQVNLWTSDGTDTGTRRIDYPGANYITPAKAYFIMLSPIYAISNNLLFTNEYDSTIHVGLYKFGTPTGISNIVEKASNVSLYPNPANNTITVAGTEVQQLIISDLSGKVLITANTESVNVSNLAPGMYIAEIISTEGERLAGKFLKQ